MRSPDLGYLEAASITELEEKVENLRQQLNILIGKSFPLIVPTEKPINSLSLYEYCDTEKYSRTEQELEIICEQLSKAIETHRQAETFLYQGNIEDLERLAFDPLDARIKFLLDRGDVMTYEQLLTIKHAVTKIASGLNTKGQVSALTLDLPIVEADELLSLPGPLLIAYHTHLGKLILAAASSLADLIEKTDEIDQKRDLD